MNPDTQIPKNGEEVKRIPLVDPRIVDDIEFKKKCILVDGGSQETQSVYVYEIIISPVGFYFVLSPF